MPEWNIMNIWNIGNIWDIGVFSIAAIAFTIFWGRILWYFDEKSNLLPRFIFYFMTFTRMTFPEIKSLILSFIYYIFGLLGGLAFSFSYHIDIVRLFDFRVQFIPLILLGIMAQISLANFFISIYLKIMKHKRINPFLEIQNSPWISGILRLPKFFVPLAPVVGGLMEEFFFRGILLIILIMKLFVQPLMAIIFVTVLFLMEQWLQLRTPVQRIIIGLGSFAISLVGGILVIYTGSIIPAAIAHMSFVVFYFGYSTPTSASIWIK